MAFVSFYDPQWYSLAYYLKEAERGGPRRPGGGPAALVDYSFPAVFCADWSLPVDGYADFAAQLAALARRAPQMMASPLALSATVGCLGWPSPASNPQRRLTGTQHADPADQCPARPGDPVPVGAERRRPARPEATLLTYDGWGHAVYGRTDCVTSAVDRYLIELRRPATGTSCPGVVPDPFGIG